MKMFTFIKVSVATAIVMSLTTGFCAMAQTQTRPATLDVFDSNTAGAQATVAFDVAGETKDTVAVGSWMNYKVNPAMQVSTLFYGFKWSNDGGADFEIMNAANPATPLADFSKNTSYKEDASIAMYMASAKDVKLTSSSIIYEGNSPLCGATSPAANDYDIVVIPAPTIAWNTTDLQSYICWNNLATTTITVPKLQLSGCGPWQVHYSIMAYTGGNTPYLQTPRTGKVEIGAISKHVDSKNPKAFAFDIPTTEFDIAGFTDADKKGIRFEVTVTAISDRIVRKALNSEALASYQVVNSKFDEKKFNVLVFPDSNYSLPVIHVKNQ